MVDIQFRVVVKEVNLYRLNVAPINCLKQDFIEYGVPCLID